MLCVPAETLGQFAAVAFERCRVPAEDAALAAAALLSSDWRGIESHGIACPENYVTMLQARRINPQPDRRVLRETPSTAAVDGDNGLGIVDGPKTDELATKKRRPLGASWATDRAGRPTLDPRDVIAGGALTPLGGTEESSARKGCCLSAMVDILSGVLAGANWGPFCPPFRIDQPIPERLVGAGLGHCFGALQIAGFCDPDEFKRNIDEWTRTLRANTPSDLAKAVLIPGDPERAAEAERRVHGIPLPPVVIADLRIVAQMTGVPAIV